MLSAVGTLLLAAAAEVDFEWAAPKPGLLRAGETMTRLVAGEGCGQRPLCRPNTSAEMLPQGFDPPPPACGLELSPGTNRLASFRKSPGAGRGVGSRLFRWKRAASCTFKFEEELPIEVEITGSMESLTPALKRSFESAFNTERWHGTVRVLPKQNGIPTRIVTSAPASAYGAALAHVRKWVKAGGMIVENGKRRSTGAKLLNKAITVTNRLDGFGSQLGFVWAALAWASRHGVPFCHTNWHAMAHVGSSLAPILEKFGGLSRLPVCEKPKSNKRHLLAGFREKTLISSYTYGTGLNMLITYVQQFADEYFDSRMRRLFRALYWSTPKPSPLSVYGPRKEGTWNIAVHYRAGDIVGKRGRGVVGNKTAVYAAVIQRALKELPAKTRGIIHWFTEKPSAKGPGGPPCPCGRHLRHDDWSVMRTFHAFVTADVLIVDCSTFSWTAAVLSEGTVYYPVYRAAMEEPEWKGWSQGGLGHASAFKSGLRTWIAYDAQGAAPVRRRKR